MPTIQIRSLSKIFGPRGGDKALRMAREGATRAEIHAETGCNGAVLDASLTVNHGECLVITGARGSGRSTLLRCVNGLIEPTAGEVRIDDLSVTGLGDAALRDLRRTRVALVLEHAGLLPHRSVRDNVAACPETANDARLPRRDIVERALELTGLAAWARRSVAELDAGLQHRVGLARALATDADILLMDQPFHSLAGADRDQMQDELLKMRQRTTKTIVFVTDDPTEADKLGDRIAFMDAGRLVDRAGG